MSTFNAFFVPNVLRTSYTNKQEIQKQHFGQGIFHLLAIFASFDLRVLL